MRRVSDPQGTRWRVDVSWTGIYFGSRFSQYRRDRAQRRRDERSGAKPRPAHDLPDWLGALDPGFDGLGELVFAAVAIVAIIALILLFPWILVLLLDLAQILVFPVVAVVIVLWRVARHRPFVITADHGVEPILTWQVVGWREARRIERAIADAVVVGGDPTHLFPELATRR